MSGGGGVLKSIGKTIGSVGGSVVKGITPGNAIGSVVGSLGGVGEVIGPAIQLGAGANPLGVFGASLGSKVLKDFIDSGGDKKKPVFVDSMGNIVYATPGADYGSSTYKMGKKALDADPYFIEGSKGIYNLLPELSKLYGNKETNRLKGATSYRVYQNIYNRMADDELAQQRLAERYGPKTLDVSWTKAKGLDPSLARLPSDVITAYDLTYKRDPELNFPTYLRRDLYAAAKEQEQALLKSLPTWDYAAKMREYNAAKNIQPYLDAYGQYKKNRAAAVAAFDPTDIQYVDWGFGRQATKKSPWEEVANYAARKNNPFFIAFDPNTGQPVAAPAESAAGATTTGTAAPAEGKASGGIVELMKNKRKFGKE